MSARLILILTAAAAMVAGCTAGAKKPAPGGSAIASLATNPRKNAPARSVSSTGDRGPNPGF